MTEQNGNRHPTDAQLLKDSLALVAPVADQLIAQFYERLFAAHPEVRPMFPAVMDAQRDKLLKAIIALVTHYERPEELMPALTAMGKRHATYGVQLEHYAAVGQCLLATLADIAGDVWNDELEGAWTRAYTFAAGAMVQGASEEVGAEQRAA
jgi:hemoglobin-like flavoprotein